LKFCCVLDHFVNQFAARHHAEAIGHCALRLRFGAAHIDDGADIGRNCHAMQSEFLLASTLTSATSAT